MNVILLDDVENLGTVGDVVTVKPGYGRNYLLPQGKAALATRANMQEVERRRAELEKAAADELAAAKDRAKLVDGMKLVIPANVGPEGKLFGSVGPIDIEQAFEKMDIEVARSEVRMAEGPIHDIGEFPVGLHFHKDVEVEITVQVVPGE